MILANASNGAVLASQPATSSFAGRPGYGAKYFGLCRSVLADRADLEHVAVIAGLERNPQLTAAIVPGHDRRHGDDALTPAVVERGTDAGLLAELDEIARCRERQ